MRARIIAAGLLFSANAALAGTWYAGADVADLKIKFEPQYSFANGRADSSFTDWAYGQEVGVLGGYKIRLCSAADVALQGRFAVNNADWTLSTDEPAHLKYEMPYTYSVSLVPTCRIVKNLIAFGEFGIGEGRVEQQKTSSANVSTYDFSQWVTGVSAGGGLRYQVSKAVSIFAIYRYTEFESYVFQSHLPDGSVAEIISDSPQSYEISGGVTVDL